ncbi:MAG: purine-binding chemotaxis protein CheW [Anaerolineae bacterium]|nr:purine-binding chemotaxis protein CheW [Anaerolineae bacterium]
MAKRTRALKTALLPAFDQVAPDAVANLQPNRPDVYSSTEMTGENVLVFRLGQQLYALPVVLVVQIVDMVTITPIPQVDPAIVGVINVHGILLPVMDMRRQLGLAETPLRLHTHMVLVNMAKQTGAQVRQLGLIVDEVIEVLAIVPEQKMQLADVLPARFHERGNVSVAVTGVARTSLGTVLLLDMEQLLTAGELDAQILNGVALGVNSDSADGGEALVQEAV